MQQSIETMVHEYDEVQTLKMTINKLHEQVAALSMARGCAVERRPGRPKRSTQ